MTLTQKYRALVELQKNLRYATIHQCKDLLRCRYSLSSNIDAEEYDFRWECRLLIHKRIANILHS